MNDDRRENELGPDFIITVSHEYQLLLDAKSLLALAENNSEHDRLLHSCAVILLAAALDEGTTKRLKMAGGKDRIDCESGAPSSEADRILNAGLRKRVMALPGFLSGRRLVLRWRSPHVQRLHELITIRNELCHVKHEQMSATPDEIISGNYIQQLSRLFEKARSPWHSISRSHSEQFLKTVELYMAEVIDVDPDGELSEGQLLSPAPKI